MENCPAMATSLKPAEPILRTSTVTGNSQNLEATRFFPINKGYRNSAERCTANIRFKFDLAGSRGHAEQIDEGLDPLSRRHSKAYNAAISPR